MGRTTYLPALGQQRRPWGDKQVFVLTSSPLPPGAPDGVSLTTAPRAEELLECMREASFGGDVHLVGGPSTIHAFREIGALDVLELLVIPAMLGDGLPLSPAGTRPQSLRLERQVIHPDGVIEVRYTLA